MYCTADLARLEEIYRKLYKDEPEDSYDMEGAILYWASLSAPELQSELAEAEQKLVAFNSY